MELLDAQSLVDNLTDWVDEGELAELNGAEADWYEDQGRPNHPFNRPFYNLDEMTLVKGMRQLDSAAAEVSIDEASLMVDQVLGPDRERNTEDDQPFTDLSEALAMLGVSEFQQQIVNPRLTVDDTTTRIVSDGRAGTIKRRITLILRSRTGQLAILDRKEEIIP